MNEPTASLRPKKVLPELRLIGPVKVSAYDAEAATASAMAVSVLLSVMGGFFRWLKNLRGTNF